MLIIDKKGYGKTLLLETLYLHHQLFPELTFSLQVNVINVPAIRLYQKVGFYPITTESWLIYKNEINSIP